MNILIINGSTHKDSLNLRVAKVTEVEKLVKRLVRAAELLKPLRS